MKKLVIVESPAKIKTISKILGKDFKIMSTVGHIMDLPKKKLGMTMMINLLSLNTWLWMIKKKYSRYL